MTGRRAIGVGYEGRDIESFVSLLRLRGVELLVDVRLNPLSRKRGFSKRGLAERLESEGIEYRHEPALGNPRDNRHGYTQASGADAETAQSIYSDRLATHDARTALQRLADHADTKQVAVLCFEENPTHCHRAQVLDALRELAPRR